MAIGHWQSLLDMKGVKFVIGGRAEKDVSAEGPDEAWDERLDEILTPETHNEHTTTTV